MKYANVHKERLHLSQIYREFWKY